MQDYEESVSFLGTWGPFQRRVFVLLALASLPSGYNMLSTIFLLATPPHHCRIPSGSNLSQEWVQASIPVQHVGGELVRSSCSRYKLDLVQNLSALGASPSRDHMQNLEQEACKDGWSYSAEYYQSTVATEFNLVCSDQWKQPLTPLAYFLGSLSGTFVSGQISDRFGRKPVLLGSIMTMGIFSSAAAFAPSWPVFVLLFFILGMGQITSFVTAFVLGSEILAGPTRIIFGSLCLQSVYAVGMMILPATAYLVRTWRHLSLIMAVPCLAYVPLWWMLPESPRWLVSRGRWQEAERLLRLAALENRLEAPRVIFLQNNVEKADDQNSESLGFLDLLKTARFRNTTLILWIIWFSIHISYFGLSFNMSSLYGNPFLNYILLAVVEFPAYFASWVALRYFLRRLAFISYSLLGALALLLIQVTMKMDLPNLTLSLVLLGKFGVLAAISTLFSYTSELSPTTVRNTAMSSCATFSRVGSCVSPYLMQLAVFSQFLPWILVGSMSLLSVVLCLLLPETFGRPLPDTIQQMAHTQRLRWPWASSPPPKDDGKSAKDQTTAAEIICTTRL